MPTTTGPTVMSVTRAAMFLTEMGYPMSKSTLLKLGRAGKGPSGVISWGCRHLYSEAALLSWVQARGTSEDKTDTPVN